jgi:hypothetical protein
MGPVAQGFQERTLGLEFNHTDGRYRAIQPMPVTTQIETQQAAQNDTDGALM